VIPIPSRNDGINALAERATALSLLKDRRVGRQVKVGKVRKPRLDILHKKVFEAKTVKGDSGQESPVFQMKAGDFF